MVEHAVYLRHEVVAKFVGPFKRVDAWGVHLVNARVRDAVGGVVVGGVDPFGAELCSLATSMSPLEMTSAARSSLPVSSAGVAALEWRSREGSGTQLASMARRVLRVTKGANLLVKKAWRLVLSAGA